VGHPEKPTGPKDVFPCDWKGSRVTQVRMIHDRREMSQKPLAMSPLTVEAEEPKSTMQIIDATGEDFDHHRMGEGRVIGRKGHM